MDEPRQISSHLARNLIALRSVRSLTQEALAKSAGVPRSTITNLESGDGNPSLGVLVKVATALNVPIDELLASPRAKVRQWKMADLGATSGGKGITLRPLVPEPVPEEMLTIMDFQPDSIMRGSPHLPGTREFFTCLDGQVVIMVAGDKYELAAGDVLAFPGNTPHSYRNYDNERSARGVSVVVLSKAGI